MFAALHIPKHSTQEELLREYKRSVHRNRNSKLSASSKKDLIFSQSSKSERGTFYVDMTISIDTCYKDEDLVITFSSSFHQ
jgi:hypothetical protein